MYYGMYGLFYPSQYYQLFVPGGSLTQLKHAANLLALQAH